MNVKVSSWEVSIARKKKNNNVIIKSIIWICCPNPLKSLTIYVLDKVIDKGGHWADMVLVHT